VAGAYRTGWSWEVSFSFREHVRSLHIAEVGYHASPVSIVFSIFSVRRAPAGKRPNAGHELAHAGSTSRTAFGVEDFDGQSFATFVRYRDFQRIRGSRVCRLSRGRCMCCRGHDSG
jgi:hypothetical protein